ncbi:hypothetical protein L3081_06165 [Colwellia sp. MSW7]|uniref:Uncharacterized protein n=1 Tax=Colwellia maritima TaxID=2912588 RepID=A0ABS9WYJ1_9GAMM|nr:hypothetical protein [Colwellia maritima]MCI2283057.1 hypothetical protein [Colwellia maritima]
MANQIQTGASEQGIVLLLTIIPAVFAALAIPLIMLYPLDNKTLTDVQRGLHQRKNTVVKQDENEVMNNG